MSRIMLRVIKGGLQPADNHALETLRARNYSVNDIVAADIRKPRNPRFHRLAHQLGSLCRENIEDFALMDAHAVLKRLQIEANIACEEIMLKIPGLGAVVQRLPKSLSYESMDEGQFREVVAAMCAHIVKQYWPAMTAEQIGQMAEAML